MQVTLSQHALRRTAHTRGAPSRPLRCAARSNVAATCSRADGSEVHESERRGRRELLRLSTAVGVGAAMTAVGLPLEALAEPEASTQPAVTHRVYLDIGALPTAARTPVRVIRGVPPTRPLAPL
jgi:hypothetical protein